MKLAVVTSCISRNGGGLYLSIRKMTQAVAALGVDCTVSGLKDEHTAADLSAWAPLEMCVYPRKGPRFFPMSRLMRRGVLESQPDILHTHGIWLYPSLVDLAAKREMKTPYVVSPRGMLDPWALHNSAYKKKLAGWLFENRHLRHADCIHALCESEYDSIRTYGLKNPVCIIPNGIDLPGVSAQQGVAPWVSHIGADKKVMLFLGRIHPKKGLKNLIHAWGILRERRLTESRDSHLVIAGWSQGGHEDELKRLSQKLGMTENVLFVGPLFGEAKDAALRAAKAFLLPSFSEGLPMSVLEAWSYGVPVIMTAECNIPEGFQSGAAVEVRPEAQSIRHGIESFLSLSEAEQKDMGLNGRRLVEPRFSWPRIAAQMIEVYRWILGQGPKPTCVKLD